MSVSLWSLNGTNIYVTDLNGSAKNTIARLQPIEGGTVLQYFGYENTITKIKAYVVGETTIATLKGYAETDSVYALMEGAIDHGDYSVSSFNFSRVPAVYQTLTNDCDDPLFIVDMELYQ